MNNPRIWLQVLINSTLLRTHKSGHLIYFLTFGSKFTFMKKILSISFGIFLLAACGSKTNSPASDKSGDSTAAPTEKVNIRLPENWKGKDLNEWGMNLQVTASDSVSIYTFTYMNEAGSQEAVNVQLADASTLKFSIARTTQDFEGYYTKLKSSPFDKITQELDKRDNAVFYEYENNKGEIYYGMLVVLSKDQTLYVMESDNMMNPVKDRKDAEILYSMALSVK